MPLDYEWQKRLQNPPDERGQFENFKELLSMGDAMRETVAASLTEVDLSGVQLTVADMEPVEFIVNCCKKLEKLNLSNCTLPATSLIDFSKHLKPGIQVLSNLNSINKKQ